MPTINSTHTIDISPERYINACSDNEVRELAILLNSKRFDRIFPGDSGNSDDFRKIPTLSGSLLLESGANDRDYIRCTLLFGDDPKEAMIIIGEIADQLAISVSQLLDMMPVFKRLEGLRLKNLVAKPQEIKEEIN